MEGRRLPSWMSVPPVKHETSSTSSVSCSKDNAAVSTQDKEAEAKELAVNLLPGNEGEKKRGKRKLHDAIKKEREKASGDAAPRKTTGTRRRSRKENRPCPSDDDDEIVCNGDIGNEDDVELTEEDLLSIANEYIAAAAAADEDLKKLSGEAKKKKKVDRGTSEFPPTKEASSIAAFGFEKSSDENKNVIVSSSSTAGCEDMLNLLLGNLLTKNVT